MFEKIRSKYIMKLLFDNIEERNKLKLIKYNKSLQNFFEKNLIKYKIFSGKYIIYETNNKGKEYDYYSSRVTFEGEYLNGKRNGKGKEYIHNKLRFEGEYLKGKKWNGTGYDEKKNCICELKEGKGLIKE